MPRYLYLCEACQVTSSAFHMIDETITDCNDCNAEGSMSKQLSTPTIIKGNLETKEIVGDITKEYIELNREILKEEKEKAKQETHDTP